MSRSVTMQGTGVSSSVTSAAPIPLAAICSAASRRVCDGPTVRTTSDIPSLTSIPHPFWIDLQFVRIAASLPDKTEGQAALKGASAYRLRRASRPR